MSQRSFDNINYVHISVAKTDSVLTGGHQCNTDSHHTNNYSEVTMQLLKDIVFACASAYNAVELVDFVCKPWNSITARILKLHHPHCGLADSCITMCIFLLQRQILFSLTCHMEAKFLNY